MEVKLDSIIYVIVISNFNHAFHEHMYHSYTQGGHSILKLNHVRTLYM